MNGLLFVSIILHASNSIVVDVCVYCVSAFFWLILAAI